MGMFKTMQCFPIFLNDLKPVGEDVIKHFQGRGFDAAGQQGLAAGWDISVGDSGQASGIFKTVLGLRTAMKIQIDPSPNGTQVIAGVGVFGSQVIPALLTYFVAWPVLLTQISGLMQNAKLDDEAIRIVGDSLRLHAGQVGDAISPAVAQGFCTSCGGKLSPGAKFCTQCGTKVA